MYWLKLKKYLVVKTAVKYIEPCGEVKYYNLIDFIVKLMKVVGQEQSNAKGAHSITGMKRKNVPLGIDMEAEEAEEDEKEEGEQDQSVDNEDDDRNEDEEGERGNIVPKLNICMITLVILILQLWCVNLRITNDRRVVCKIHISI